MNYAEILMALCCWREARGESAEAQRGVIWTILNRAAKPAWWNGNKVADPVAVILMPKQYSSFNAGDPNATKFPSSTDSVWLDILDLVISGLGEDPTGGATHYFSGDVVPSWAAEMTKTCEIGAFTFYK